MSRVIDELLRHQARERPDQLFMVCGPHSYTYAQTDQVADRVAHGLEQAGVAPGQRVAIIASNRAEMLELLFGCARLGAIQVPLNAFLKGEFLRYQLDDSQADALVADRAGMAAVAALGGTPANLRVAVSLDEPSCALAGATMLPYSRLTERGGFAASKRPTISDLVSIMYTSGTTGMPKGCMLSNGYYTHVGYTMANVYDVHAGDVILTATPLYHGAARMMCVMAALVSGTTIVIEPEYHASRFLARAREVGATVMFGMGAMGAALVKQPPGPGDRDHKLRFAMWVPFSPELQRQFAERFGIESSGEVYGQTECVPVTYTLATADKRNRASCGRPAPYLEVRLVDDDDAPVPVGSQGEIALRPREPHVMFQGYWRKPEATVTAFRNLWYHTGDFGRADADGFITFVDRKKDALRRRGENVSSVELETAILCHSSVAEVAVHAVPSELLEDEIKACLVLKPGASVEPRELFEFFKGALPYFTIPRYVEVVPELPRNATLRVMKHVLRDRGVTESTWDLHALGLVVSREERRA
ncbi:MAG: AMP-binding protein [Planctomycetaceae bacterium]